MKIFISILQKYHISKEEIVNLTYSQLTGVLLAVSSLIIVYLILRDKNYLKYTNQINYLTSFSPKTKKIVIITILTATFIYSLSLMGGLFEYHNPFYSGMVAKWLCIYLSLK